MYHNNSEIMTKGAEWFSNFIKAKHILRSKAGFKFKYLRF